MPDRIHLNTGTAPWIERLKSLLAMAAAGILLAAPSPASWRFAGLAALVTFLVLERRYSRQQHSSEILLLHPDGTLRLCSGRDETDGLLSGAWVSRSLCVLHWTPLDGASRRHSLVSASRNHGDDYRRLLVCLRMGSFRNGESPSW